MSASSTARRIGIGVALLLTAGYGCNDAATPVEPRHHGQASPLIASTIVVTNTDDDGPGSLRQAIADATDGTVIQFDPSIAGGTIVLQSRLLTNGPSFTIEGPATKGITLSGDALYTVLFVQAGDVVLRNLTITEGFSESSAVAVGTAGSLTVDHSTLTGNSSTAGAGGEGFGGAIVARGSLTVINSTISGNDAYQDGGGIAFMPLASGKSLLIVNSTITNNVAVTAGGLFVDAGQYSPSITIRHSIIHGNSATGFVNCDFQGAAVTYVGTSIAGLSCGGPPEVVATDPALDPLADNGGPTMTHALQPGSPALDAATLCNVADDQRYVPRPVGPACDVGAYEYVLPLVLTVDASQAVNPKTGTATVTGRMTCSSPVALQLRVTLTQNQKAGRAPSTVNATATAQLNCDGASAWAVAVTPSSGSFTNGTASAMAQPLNPGSQTATAQSVKLFWGHK